jgi:excinuclease UvrABC ATPase subunit
MPDYQDSKIYKIVNYDNDDVYIGSTTEPTLARRLAKHVGNYKSYLNGKSSYTTSYKIIETGNYDIQLIEAFPCNNKMELHAREGYWIKQLECVNKVVPGRTAKEYGEEYREKNKDMIREKKKRYNEKNKENIAEYHKEYRKNHKETISGKRTKKEQCICGITFTRCHKARHMKTNKHQSYINSIEFYQDVYDMVKSIVKKIPKNI